MRRDERYREGRGGEKEVGGEKGEWKKHRDWLSPQDEWLGKADREGAHSKYEGKPCTRVKGRDSLRSDHQVKHCLEIKQTEDWTVFLGSWTLRAVEVLVITKESFSSINIKSFKAQDYEWKSQIVSFINGLLLGPNKRITTNSFYNKSINKQHQNVFIFFSWLITSSCP